MGTGRAGGAQPRVEADQSNLVVGIGFHDQFARCFEGPDCLQNLGLSFFGFPDLDLAEFIELFANLLCDA